MNGDEMQQREISDIITGINSEHCVRSCDVHPFMKLGVVKSLRLGEANVKMLRILLIICGGNLLSTWFKDGEITRELFKLAGAFLHSTIGMQ
jgi:hypothetical protein